MTSGHWNKAYPLTLPLAYRYHVKVPDHEQHHKHHLLQQGCFPNNVTLDF